MLKQKKILYKRNKTLYFRYISIKKSRNSCNLYRYVVKFNNKGTNGEKVEVASLHELIQTLSVGTKLHIGVLFFGAYGNEKMKLPHVHEIHGSQLCEAFKSTAKGYKRCFACRNYAIRKAVYEKKSFGGQCINGIYEYTHPIIEGDIAVGMIYIGNVLPRDASLLKERINERTIDEKYLNSLEGGVSEEECKLIAKVIESYIKMLSKLNTKKATNNDSLIDNLKRYVLANLEYPFNAKRVSEVFHYNAKYLGRLFKSVVGMSLSEYVNKNRIERAKERLLFSKKTIIEIAYETGFENVTYFNRIFKKYENTSPTQFRSDNKTKG